MSDLHLRLCPRDRTEWWSDGTSHVRCPCCGNVETVRLRSATPAECGRVVPTIIAEPKTLPGEIVGPVTIKGTVKAEDIKLSFNGLPIEGFG